MRATGYWWKLVCSMAPFLAVISPNNARLVPKTAAPSNWDLQRFGVHDGAGVDSSVHLRNRNVAAGVTSTSTTVAT